MKTNEAIRKIAEELGIPYEVCKLAYDSSWEFIILKMKELPFHDDLTEEEFRKFRPNFNMPSLGKFAVTWDKYKRVKNRFAYIKNLKKQKENDSKDTGNQASVQPTDSD